MVNKKFVPECVMNLLSRKLYGDRYGVHVRRHCSKAHIPAQILLYARPRAWRNLDKSCKPQSEVAPLDSRGTQQSLHTKVTRMPTKAAGRRLTASVRQKN
jgi:hypothetical protein